MIFSVFEFIVYFLCVVILLFGDFFFMGILSGVGLVLKRYLKVGDVIDM